MRVAIFTLILLCESFVGSSQTPTHSLSGVVTDPQGALVPGARVSATSVSKSGAGEPRLFKTVTDDEGRFTIVHVPPGGYRLSVSSLGFAETERLVSVPQGKSVEIRMQIDLGLGCDTLSEGSGTVTDGEKAEIARRALAEVVGGTGLLMAEQRNKELIVSTENVRPEWFQDVTYAKLKFLTPKQIQDKADREGDFLYLSFPYFKARGQCVALEVSNTWAVGKTSTMLYLSGGGYRYEFSKRSGEWVMRPVGGWVS